jgi:hypothetical protein
MTKNLNFLTYFWMQCKPQFHFRCTKNQLRVKAFPTTHNMCWRLVVWNRRFEWKKKLQITNMTNYRLIQVQRHKKANSYNEKRSRAPFVVFVTKEINENAELTLAEAFLRWYLRLETGLVGMDANHTIEGLLAVQERICYWLLDYVVFSKFTNDLNSIVLAHLV